ncbi:MAG: hypothetical protein CH6_1107 [Candidatus Kapaibacterium sp.]|nr:MAG: hypothetical protein CH6_1107 [Candidatus Kapabacteria bacterium]
MSKHLNSLPIISLLSKVQIFKKLIDEFSKEKFNKPIEPYF